MACEIEIVPVVCEPPVVLRSEVTVQSFGMETRTKMIDMTGPGSGHWRLAIGAFTMKEFAQ